MSVIEIIPEPRYIATDDRGITPKNTPCEHRACRDGGCKMWDARTLEITPADRAMGEQLVAEGWRQVSAKYREVVMFKVSPPSASDIIRSEYLDTDEGRALARYYEGHIRFAFWKVKDQSLLEHATLSPSVHAAFKAAGGKHT